jgi:hypothetical protein
MRKKDVKLFGFGINDSETPVYLKERVNGKWRNKWVCPAYTDWYSMLRRSFSSVHKKRCQSYKEVTCCEDWLLFSNFKSWWDEQQTNSPVPLEDLALDKDLLGNSKLYSPETCCYITQKTNSFISSLKKFSGLMLGVINGKNGRFIAQCQGYRGTKRGWVGSSDNELDAHIMYLKAKVTVLDEILNTEFDANVVGKLQEIREKLLFHINNRIEFKNL